MKAVCHFCRRECGSGQGVRAHLKSCPPYLERKRGASEPETMPSRPGDPQDEVRSPQEQDVGTEASMKDKGNSVRFPNSRTIPSHIPTRVSPLPVRWTRHY